MVIVTAASVSAPDESDAAAAPRLLWDAATLAHALDVSVPTIWRRTADGKLPRPVRLGGAVRWRADEVRRWLDAGCPDRATWEAMAAVKRP